MNRYWITGAALFTTMLVTSTAWADRTETRQCVVSPQATIRVDNVAGEIVVIGWDREELQLEARMDDRIEEMIFDCSETRVDLRFKYPKRARDCKAWATLHVPRGATIEVEAISAEIKASALSGDVSLKTVSGNLELLASDCTRIDAVTVSGNLDLEASAPWIATQSTSGNIEIRGHGNELIASNTSGHIRIEGQYVTTRLESVSGNVDLNGLAQYVESRTVSGKTEIGVIGAPGTDDASARINTVSGRVALKGEHVRDLRVESISGRFEYEGSLSPTVRGDVSSTSDNILFTLTGPLDARIDARSNSGNVDASDFGLQTPRTNGSGQHVEGVSGSGEGRLTLQSLSGNVSLRSR